MFKSKASLVAFAMVLYASMAPIGTSALADDPTWTRKIKSVVKHGIMPLRPGIGVLRTGQTTPYATGDDGDLQRGVPWPKPRFADHGDGTVTDRATGLMWIKDVELIPEEMNWYDAVETCNELAFAGYENWRLPNIREILSLIDFGEHDPPLPSHHPFINVQSSRSYWSGTTAVPHTAQAWRVDMTNGILRRNNKTTQRHRVWSVRRGKKHTW